MLILSYACPDANMLRERLWKLSTPLDLAPYQSEQSRDQIRKDRLNPAYEETMNELTLHIKFCPTCRSPRFNNFSTDNIYYQHTADTPENTSVGTHAVRPPAEARG